MMCVSFPRARALGFPAAPFQGAPLSESQFDVISTCAPIAIPIPKSASDLAVARNRQHAILDKCSGLRYSIALAGLKHMNFTGTWTPAAECFMAMAMRGPYGGRGALM